ncbi:MAG TPA: TIGR03621 family F420-dependent LLM class oxidoreductase [Acidimicrobiales bacterium]|nr:TIGR03621 family F420-dependent LLM class oxidoreductase [Acidimicrobiales bacterium]
MRPFKFSVQYSTAPDGKTWREFARKVEDLGVDTLYIPDHFGDQWAPTIGMTIAAEATSTLKVGALVYDVDYRHPVTLAKEIATLDLASEGRVVFGFGAGWMKTDYDESGISYDSPGTRIDRMEEALTIMKALWRDGTATFAGKHYNVTRAQGLPRPFEGKCPPIVIGGGGKKVLTIAAREADTIGINPNLKSGAVDRDTALSGLAERYDERLGWIRDAAGDRFENLDLQVLTFFVQITDDADTIVENMAPLFGMTPEQVKAVPMALVGTEGQIVETLQARRERFGLNDIVIHEPELDAFAPIIARLAGT